MREVTPVRDGWVPRSQAELLARLPADWPRRDVRLPGGATLSVRVADPAGPGPGEPALFVHGLGGQATNWTDLMAVLRDRLAGVAVDLPGFGWSPPPPDGRWSPQASAELLADLVRTLWAGEPVHLFGNSLGGAVAVQLAARQPELVRTLTLVSPALPRMIPRRTNVHLPVVAVPGVGPKLVARYLTLPADLRARATVRLCFADPSVVPEPRLRAAVEELRRRDAVPWTGEAFTQSLRGLLATYLDRSPERPWRLAARIAAPTLVIHGHRDRLVDPAAAHASVFPDGRVALLFRCGHVAQLEDPVLVGDLWRTLLP